MNINKKTAHLIIPVLIALACASVDTVQVSASNNGFVDTNAEKLVETVKKFNEKSPESISASLFIDADMQNQNYKATGNAVLNRNTGNISLTLHDYVFKSPLFNFIEENDRLYFYYPADRKLLVDHPDKIKMSVYTELDIDYYLIKGMTTGRMPFLKNYKINRAAKDPEKDEYYLVLENSSYFQTIFIENEKPVKTMIIDKSTGSRQEIHFSNYHTSGDTGIFRRVRILAPDRRIDVKVELNNVRLNTGEKPRSLSSMNIPGDVKKIYHNR